MTVVARTRSVVSASRPSASLLSTRAKSTSALPRESVTEQSRPQMHVIQGRGMRYQNGRVQYVWKWVRSRSAPMLYVVISVFFLLASLLGSLTLRTSMAENSFESSQVRSNITRLAQDVETQREQLDALSVNLPQQAQKMGMVPALGGITVDLQGYRE